MQNKKFAQTYKQYLKSAGLGNGDDLIPVAPTFYWVHIPFKIESQYYSHSWVQVIHIDSNDNRITTHMVR
jgi:hypothetical protein